jgi:hypothetical protein
MSVDNQVKFDLTCVADHKKMPQIFRASVVWIQPENVFNVFSVSGASLTDSFAASVLIPMGGTPLVS